MRWVKILFYSVVCLFVFVLATSLTIRFVLKDDSTVACPDVTGMDIEEARRLAEQRGLALAIAKYEARRDVAYNRVLFQQPDAEMPVKIGRSISVVLSDGPQPIAIPLLVGLSLEEAQTTLEDKDLALKKIIYVPSAYMGTVLAQVPESGENILDGGMVLVVGGHEKRFFIMPDMATGDYSSAMEEMDRKQIKYTVESTADGAAPDGPRKTTVKTSLPPRTIFNQDDVLRIQINNGG